ncbi:hypothetical protein F5148DRAFT_1284510 [Russula earlei]|uniref:Uncharacterized protein n=1 Tax=Russula earlei TaxID=71964 RepID=A0ACC0UAV4_9AGAM|nr:hypothetical protein F5148DRAFT_1284510 [Russula earlei]
MAAPNSVPRVYRRYHYQHLPPPTDPNTFMVELRRGLRGAKRVSFWGTVKSVGWRFLLKFDKHREEQTRRPDFPVAAPSTPVPLPPVIHVSLAEDPDHVHSPPPPHQDGFLFVSMCSSPASRPRRRERRPLSPRPLPTPPPYPLPEIKCCPLANSPSTQPSPISTSADSDEDPEDRFFTQVAPFLFLVDGGSEDEGERAPQDSDGIRDVAADKEFLEEIGLDQQGFMALLDGININWGEGEAGRD